MPVHPDVAARFHHLDGLSSLGEAYRNPELMHKIRAFESWEPHTPPPSVDSTDTRADGPHGAVPVRVYRPAGLSDGAPCLIWLHGGAFMGGDLQMREADWTAREVSARAGAVVVSVDYRLAVGGVHYPVPHDDAVAAVRWVRDRSAQWGIDAERIVVGGASAGANLVTGAVLEVRDVDDWVPRAVVGVYGVFHPLIPGPSRSLAVALAELPAVFASRPEPGDPMAENYLGGPLSRADGYAFPALAVLAGLCPLVLLNAEYDALRSSGEAFAAAAALAGVDVRQVLIRGMLHGFLNLPAECAPVAGCLDEIAATVAGVR